MQVSGDRGHPTGHGSTGSSPRISTVCSAGTNPRTRTIGEDGGDRVEPYGYHRERLGAGGGPGGGRGQPAVVGDHVPEPGRLVIREPRGGPGGHRGVVDAPVGVPPVDPRVVV